MERIVFVVFGDVAGARAGLRAISALDRDGAIALYAATVVAKASDGTYEPSMDTLDSAPLVSAGLRRFLHAVEGSRVNNDVLQAEWIDVDGDFIGHAYATFESGGAALVADIDEDRVTPVDARMEALRGTVLRRARMGLTSSQLPERLAVVDAEIAQLDVERVHADTLRRPKLERATTELLTRRDRILEEATKRRDAARREAAEKVRLLARKAASGGAAGALHRERIALLSRAHGLTVDG
jgi:hypothetical protein